MGPFLSTLFAISLLLMSVVDISLFCCILAPKRVDLGPFPLQLDIVHTDTKICLITGVFCPFLHRRQYPLYWHALDKQLLSPAIHSPFTFSMAEDIVQLTAIHFSGAECRPWGHQTLWRGIWIYPVPSLCKRYRHFSGSSCVFVDHHTVLFRP